MSELSPIMKRLVDEAHRETVEKAGLRPKGGFAGAERRFSDAMGRRNTLLRLGVPEKMADRLTGATKGGRTRNIFSAAVQAGQKARGETTSSAARFLSRAGYLPGGKFSTRQEMPSGYGRLNTFSVPRRPR